MRFCGCPINRAAALAVRRDPAAVKARREGPSAQFMLVCGPRILMTAADSPQMMRIAWQSLDEVLQKAPDSVEAAIYLGPLSSPEKAMRSSVREVFAVQLNGSTPPATENGATKWLSGRDLLMAGAAEDASIAGLALALTAWHETAKFDGRSGAPTVPVEGGLKRKAEGSSSKVYPRVDPVVIGLIASPDGQKCLLGRSQNYPPGMYTCLSGFIDQCESVEEAFAREAFEEAHINLSHVEMVGSQAWPIGRGGSCELMLGCRAVAASEHFEVNPSEIEDAKWFAKSDVEMMLDRSLGKRPRQEGELIVPGPWAIAHHLIADWASSTRVPVKHLEAGQAGKLRQDNRDRAAVVACAVAAMLGLFAGMACRHFAAAFASSRL